MTLIPVTFSWQNSKTWSGEIIWPLTILVKFALATARLRVPPEGSVGEKFLLNIHICLLTYFLYCMLAYFLLYLPSFLHTYLLTYTIIRAFPVACCKKTPIGWYSKVLLVHCEVVEIFTVLILRTCPIWHIMYVLYWNIPSLDFFDYHFFECKHRQSVMFGPVAYTCGWNVLKLTIFFVIHYERVYGRLNLWKEQGLGKRVLCFHVFMFFLCLPLASFLLQSGGVEFSSC